VCGIFGIVGSYDEQAAKKSLDLLSPRGRDGFGFEASGGYFFGQTRLAVMDIDLPSGPFCDDGHILTFNGEIYNYKALAENLNIRPPFCEGDVILAGLKKEGISFLKKPRGMFAISYFDGQKLFLARDDIGKKPLFYTIQNNTLIFASEIKSILGHIHKTKISKEGLNGYFGFMSTVAPYTIYEGILKLSPGEYLEFDGRDTRLVRFSSVLESIYDGGDESYCKEKTRERFFEGVGLRLCGDVEIGSLLSGGMDSALVLAVASKVFGKKLKTFTVGYGGYDGYDERGAAAESSKLLSSEHYEFEFGKEDFFASLDRFIEYMDEPLNDPAALPLDFLTAQIRKIGIKCVLSGEGSDEQYYGYRKYVEYAKFEALDATPHKGWLKNYFESHIAYNKEWEWFLRAFRGEPVYRGYGENFLDSQRDRLFGGEHIPSISLLSQVLSEFSDGGGGDYWRWASFVDFRTWLAETLLHKVDRVSMHNGVEVRAPFLDREFVSHSLSVPSGFKIPTSPKSYLKETFADILPSQIANRDKKGFSYPYMQWLKEDGSLEVIRKVSEESGLFDRANIEFYMKPRKDKGFRHHLWGLYIFSRWFDRRFL